MSKPGAALSLTIDPSAAAAPFEQLRAAVVEAVQSGRLAAGDRLPTVRALAEQLGLAANTVAKAYRALEADGVIETRGRNGTVVAEHGDPARRALQHAAAEYAALARRVGVDAVAAREIVDAALHD
ncbi:GntR family transcriptional regulator [Agromyces soli]|uniref:GntR family transcriptional regulator n=1 Tax=Agromyces soli TaxID=659012 RepID=A0ABY4AUM9_9MICO|nr:GntR family transcriptional regulator [Agromyces soli]UOE26874.1 GntR family transcriptional regulator [Agromyces soli]